MVHALKEPMTVDIWKLFVEIEELSCYIPYLDMYLSPNECGGVGDIWS